MPGTLTALSEPGSGTRLVRFPHAIVATGRWNMGLAFPSRDSVGVLGAMAVSRPGPGWFGYRGRISRRQLSTAVPDIGHRDVFACGPCGFMDEVRVIHAAEGAERGRFHFESFGDRAIRETAPLLRIPGDREGPSHELRIGDRTVLIGAGETILQGALRNGVVIPCGCGQGLCGTCRVKRVSGRFAMAHQGGLSPEEEEEGYLLACSSRIEAASEIKL